MAATEDYFEAEDARPRPILALDLGTTTGWAFSGFSTGPREPEIDVNQMEEDR